MSFFWLGLGSWKWCGCETTEELFLHFCQIHPTSTAIFTYITFLILHTQKKSIFFSLTDIALSDVKVYFSFDSPYPDVWGLITSVKTQNLCILFVSKLYFIFPHIFSARNVYFSKSLYSLWSHGIHVKCCLQVPVRAHRTSTCFFLKRPAKQWEHYYTSFLLSIAILSTDWFCWGAIGRTRWKDSDKKVGASNAYNYFQSKKCFPVATSFVKTFDVDFLSWT